MQKYIAFLLLVYRNAIYFQILTLYPASLLNSFISSNIFLVESLECPIYCIMSSTNNDNFTSFFPVLMTFFFFSCLISLVRTSNMLSKGGECRHSYLAPELRGEIFSFSPLNICGFVIYGLYYVYVHSLKIFNHSCGIFSNAFSAYIEMVL